ncbi:MAG TPA: TRAP transporter large permease [Hyphomicrobiaceae bacterium]|nr:TRAP transporter large permease [Hyphomicrobiaceae bacterium]
MSGTAAALVGFGAMLALIAIRMPVGLAMLVTGSIGFISYTSLPAYLSFMKTRPYTEFASFTLSVIPLFILMGALAEKSGLSTALFNAAAQAFARVRGGLAMAVIGACTAFGAICGSSVATTATFGRAALPELLRFGYNGGFATGTIAVGGTLGILIPPSVILVVYAITTEQNIAKLFMAALIPGLLAATFYCIAIALIARASPEKAPLVETRSVGGRHLALSDMLVALTGVATIAAVLWFKPVPRLLLARLPLGPLGTFEIALSTGLVALAAVVLLLAWLARRSDPLRSVLPVIAIAFVVVGGIYGGVFTPTEGAAVGAIAMLLLGLVQGTLDWPKIRGSLLQTAETTGMVFIILLGADLFDAFLARTQMPEHAAEWITGLGLSPYTVLVALLVFYIVLGAVMDELAMLLLTLPVFFPIIQKLNFGLPPEEVAIWFGILVLIVVGIGLTAPPIGLNVFVISSIARGVPMPETYRGVLPFILMDILRLALVVLFPGLALWLVRLLS